MKFIDFFAGIGGFRHGLELAEHKCIGFCEIDKYAVMSYTSMHLINENQRASLSKLSLNKRQKEILKEEYRNGEWYANDIRNVQFSNLPRADCWCCGSCCQSFSINGKRLGLNGESGIIQEMFRLLSDASEQDKPEWIIIENVKGILSSFRGFDFLSILSKMDRGGYDIEWSIFNSKDFGVPQNRERVYIIGHLRTKGRKKILPIIPTNEKITSTINHKYIGIDYNVGGVERNISNTIKARYDAGVTNFKQDGTAVIDLEPPKDVEKIYYKRRNQDIAIRKLTPRECFRLQGWSDEYFDKAQFINSNTQLYKQAGNGVTINIVKQIGEKLK